MKKKKIIVKSREQMIKEGYRIMAVDIEQDIVTFVK
jgi:hypothetical protein